MVLLAATKQEGRPMLKRSLAIAGVVGSLLAFSPITTPDHRTAEAASATYFDIDAARPIPQCAIMVLQVRVSGRRKIGYPPEGWADPGGQAAMEMDLSYVLDLLIDRNPLARNVIQGIKDNPLRYYEDDPTSPANPTRAAVENDLNELLQMLGR